MPVNVLLLLAGHVLPSPAMVPCSVRELRHQPSGYQYRVERIADFVDSADVIVRVRAAKGTEIEEWPGHVSTAIRFQVLETLRGPTDSSIVLPGRFVDHDDFNPLPVPYQMVRPSGQRGECHTREYRQGREYLLLLDEVRGRLTTEWMPLAPLNEQVRGADDEWVRWVRAAAHTRDRTTRERLVSKPKGPADPPDSVVLTREDPCLLDLKSCTLPTIVLRRAELPVGTLDTISARAVAAGLYGLTNGAVARASWCEVLMMDVRMATLTMHHGDSAWSVRGFHACAGARNSTDSDWSPPERERLIALEALVDSVARLRRLP